MQGVEQFGPFSRTQAVTGLSQRLQQFGERTLVQSQISLRQGRADQTDHARPLGKALLQMVEDHAVELCHVQGRFAGADEEITRGNEVHGRVG